VRANDEEARRVSGKPVAVVLAVIFIGVALVKWWPSDTRAVRRQLDAIADVLSVPPAESDLSRAARIADLRSYLSPDVHVHLTGQDITSRDTVMALAERWSPPPGGMFLEFLDEKIAFPGDGVARVELTARMSRKNPDTGDTDVDDRPTSVDLARRDGDWVVTSVESLARPGVQ
jgi:hypothetical protein